MPPVQPPTLPFPLQFLLFFFGLSGSESQICYSPPCEQLQYGLMPGNHSESNGGNARAALQVVAGADRIAEIQFFFLQGGSVAQCM